MNDFSGVEIAVIGMSGEFPGAEDLHVFWDNLKQAKESVSFFSEEELAQAGVPSDIYNAPGYVKANAFIEGKRYFDADFFGYRPEEAELMDPQIRIFHEHCWKAIEDAGIDILKNEDKIGLFAGGANSVNWITQAVFANEEGKVDSFSATQLYDIAYLCSRISYALNLQGPTMYINTACSTSLVAIQRAAMSLLLRECRVALAGGVALGHASVKGYHYEEGMVNSKDGHCRSYDDSAMGTIRAEGVGVVTLKRLKDALDDGDHIYAIIRGSGINNDGSAKMSFTAPSQKGQYKSIAKAYQMAKVDPKTVSMIEGHGSGTPLGDPIEVEALQEVFKGSSHPCALGSVKTNIGHADAAAGVAGFIKAVLSLKNKAIPASLNFEQPSAKIDFQKGPFFVNTELKPWEQNGTPRRAGVSSFGMGGTNVHLVLEESPDTKKSSNEGDLHVLKLSAKTPEALQVKVSQLAEHLDNHPEQGLSDITYTLNTGRADLACRKTVVSGSREDLLTSLRSDRLLTHVKPLPANKHVPVIFMFAGQSAEYPGMYKELYQHQQTFQKELDNCLSIASRFTSRNLKELLFSQTEESALIHDTVHTHPLLFSVQYALAKTAMSLGVIPDAVIGYSLGEYVATCLAGGIQLDKALQIICKRGELMQSVASGKMMGVSITEAELEGFLNGREEVSLAIANSTELNVVAGTDQGIDFLKQELEKEGFSCMIIPGASAYHTHLMQDMEPAFRNALDQVSFQPLEIPVISNLDGKKNQPGEILGTDYWVRHLLTTMRFKDGIDTIMNEGEATFVEIGPGIELSVFVRSNANRTRTHRVANLSKHQDHVLSDRKQFYNGIGKLWEFGIDIDWNQLYTNQSRQKLSLPTYAFERKQFTSEADAQALLSARLRNGVGQEVIRDLDNCLYGPAWETADQGFSKETSYNYYLLFNDGSNIVHDLKNQLISRDQKVIEVTSGKEFSHEGHQFVIDPKEPSHVKSMFHELEPDHILVIFGWGLYEPESERSNEAGFYEELNRSCYALIHLSRCIDEFFAGHTVNIKTLSTGLHQVFPVDQVLPEKAPLLAAIRLINKEFPNLTVQNIDLISSEEQNSELLFKEVMSSSDDLTVAFRLGSRLVQRLKPISVPEADTAAIEKGDVILITGGAGGMGLNFQRQLAHKELTFVVTGRSELPPRAEWGKLAVDDKSEVLGTLLAVEAKGSNVAYYQANAKSESDMSRVVKEAEAAYGQITGVIHSAGGIDYGGVLQHRTAKDDTHIWEPKVLGVMALQALFESRPLKFMVLCSSNASIAAPEGEFAYVAANLFLNAFARKFKGIQKVISINWNHVRQVGMAREAAKTLAGRGIHTVIDSISPEEAVTLLQRAITLGLPELVVSRHNLSQVYETVNLHEVESVLEVAEAILKDPDAMRGALTQLWSNFFGKKVVPEDDFFELGGDSLKAITLIGRINQNFSVNITIKEFLNHAQVESLHALIQQKKSKGDQGYSAIPKSENKAYYALTPVQHRLYFVHQLDKKSLAYNTPRVIRLEGKLDHDKLTESVSALESRHHSLRATFAQEGKEPVQKVHPVGFLKPEFQHLDEDIAIQEKAKSLVKPFDLEKGPIVRIVILEASEEDHYLFLDMHHIITDGTSHNLIVRDFLHFYKGLDLPELPIQYEDYAEWLHQDAQLKSLEEQKKFWLEQYREEPVMLDIPTDFPRPEERSFKGDVYEFPMSRNETSKLKKLSEAKGVTPYVLMLSVYKLFLSKLCNQKDIVIGSPTAGRRYPELENLIGMFINTLPIRSSVKPHHTFDEFLEEIQQLVISSFDNQDVPLDELIDELKLERETGRNPLFDVEFVFKSFEDEVFDIDGLKYTPIQLEQNTAFDILLSVFETNDQLYFRWEYTKELFSEATVAKFSTFFINLMNQIFEDTNLTLSQYHFLDEVTRSDLLGLSKGPTLEVPSEQVITTFEKTAAQYPDQIALKFDGTNMSYQTLNEKANAVAEQLATRTSVSGRVALLFPPGYEMIICMVAVQKACLTYVPLSPETPELRNQNMIKDCQADILLAHPDCEMKTGTVETLVIGSDKLEASTINPKRKDDPERPIYIIYTSGTSGQPKGVEVLHSGVSNFIHWRIEQYGFDASHNTLQLLSYHFDGFASNMYAALLSGGTLTLVRDEHRLDTRALLTHADLLKVTNLVATPGIYGALLEGWTKEEAKTSTLQFVILAGEAATPALLQASEQKFPGVAVHNEYGPTETSIGATHFHNMDASAVTKIGKPVANTRAYVLGSHGELLPKGAKGELCIAGNGLAVGYLQQPELTEAKFVHYDSIGERVYRTGDLVRYLTDGNLEFLGRIDSQIKIRGFRVELGEISRQILQLTEVKEVYLDVFTKEDDKFIAAYCIAEREEQVRSVKARIEQQLPPYMVPDHYAFLQEVPLTNTGKVDLTSLKETSFLKAIEATRSSGTVSVLEQQIAEIWKDVLKIDSVNVDDRFFDIGGTSLSVIKLKPRIEEIVGKEIDIYALFKYPTIEKFVSGVFPEERVAEEKEVSKVSLQKGKANKLKRLSKKL